MIHIVITEINCIKATHYSKDTHKIVVINTMATDKRKHLRFELPVNVKLTTRDGTELVLQSHDISDSGIFLRGDSAVLPAVGEQILIKLASMVAGDEPRELTAIVVRQNNDGIGIEFILDESE